MLTGIKGRIAILMSAAVLVGGAIVVRVWLAATGGYNDAPMAMTLRVSSGISLFLGFLLAALTVAWPMQRVVRPQKPLDEAEATTEEFSRERT